MLGNCLFCLNGPVSDSQNRPRAEISGALSKNRNVFIIRGIHLELTVCFVAFFLSIKITARPYTIFNNLTAPDIE